MHTSPPTLPAIVAGLRAALEADARGVSTLLLALLAQLDSLFRAWSENAPGPHADQYEDEDRLPFHLRLRDARRALILSRGSRGRLRIPTWRARNRGARALPSRALAQPRPITARAPPHAQAA